MAAPVTVAGKPFSGAGDYYAQNPSAAADQYMMDSGYSPTNHTRFSDWMRQMVTALAKPLIQNNFGGNGQLATDQMSDPTGPGSPDDGLPMQASRGRGARPLHRGEWQVGRAQCVRICRIERSAD